MSSKKLSINIGGKWAISWRVTFYSIPVLFFYLPLTQGGFTSWWAFWRWGLVSIFTIMLVLIILLIADVTVFKDRIKKPVPNFYVFILGFLIGFTFCLSSTIFARIFQILNIQDQSFLNYLLISAFNGGFIGMLALPFTAIIASSREIYQNDRNALIADRMLHQSQKSESLAVIKSLRSSMTRKVDENLLKVIKDSQEYFDEKGRSLEKNWELMAVRLRKAALDTIRPFSHQLHRVGEERVYRVKLSELLRFIASNVRVEIGWIILGYIVLNFRSIFESAPFILAFANLLFKIFIIYLVLSIIGALKNSGRLSGFFPYFLVILIFTVSFEQINKRLDQTFQVEVSNNLAYFADGLLLILLILTIGFVSAFFYGQHAESEFLERQLSKEQLEAMLMKREEERLSRELAKYLHGTIQSRLMASAIALEKAGRKGDKKALERELAQAYESLRVPSASYFSAPEDSFKAEVAKVVSKWSDLLKIKTKIDKSVGELDPSKAQEIGNAINEGISNSFRHGRASEVKLNISRSKNVIKVEIIDNGSGPQGGRGGLGTEWFNAISGKSWSLKPNNNLNGSKLELVVEL